MSLEAKIELLTAAVRDLIDVMHNQQGVSLQQIAKPEMILEELPNVSVPIAAAGVGSSSAKASELPNGEPKSKPATDTSETSSQASGPAVSYEAVKQVTIAVSKIDKAKAVAGLARFGVTTAKALNEDQWPAYVAYMQKVAAGEVD